ncbi:TPA: hypothetical protein ACTXF0_003734 [Klebsiella pneumoniae]
MPINIVDNRKKKKKFCDVPLGGMFEVNGTLYMRIKSCTGSKVNAVGVTNGSPVIFSADDAVWEANVEIHING